MALVCDAGTPTVSDPGFKLVDAAHKSYIKVTSLPGPTAPITALSLSGFPSDRYVFEGFLSKVESLKIEKLERVKESETTAIFFESTERILKTLLSIEKIFGPNQVVFVSFELTKFHEKYLRLSVQQIYELMNNHEDYKHMRGEITFIIPPYLPVYNSDLRMESILKDSKSDLIYKLNIEEVAGYLDKKLEASDKDLANILCDIFKIQKNKAMTCVSKVKEKSREKRSK
jgi:16S rRNA (cytidine1402-2'-O)-methyltransferase